MEFITTPHLEPIRKARVVYLLLHRSQYPLSDPVFAYYHFEKYQCLQHFQMGSKKVLYFH